MEDMIYFQTGNFTHKLNLLWNLIVMKNINLSTSYSTPQKGMCINMTYQVF